MGRMLDEMLLFFFRAGVPLQQRTPEGYSVVMSKLKDTDPAKFHFGNSVKL